MTRSRIAVALLAMCMLAVGIPTRVYANPEGGIVSAGQATITVRPATVDVHQQSDKAVIDWRSFDIDNGETTEFHQPNANAIALNRVHSSQASVINGALKANGNVIIVNQNGVLFGRNARVDVNGLVATTADIDNDKFMNQSKLTFEKPGNPNASIINQGQITARESGLVGFVAPSVENDGIIAARLGRVHLASGDKATVDFYGDGLMEVGVSDDVRQQLVKNTGSISADGGTVALTAAAGNRILASAIEVGGSVSAQSVSMRNGRIVIAGLTTKNHGVAGTVRVSGDLNVAGNNAGQKGGSIAVTGDKIRIASSAKLNASGHAGGGDIKIGGDYQGHGATHTASTLVVERGASVLNDALHAGNGGRTILWSNGATDFTGFISNRGGQFGGNGGFVEVSGKNFLGYRGLVDTRAPLGRVGSLLLDPANLTISNLADSDITAGTPFDSTGAATSNLNVGTLVAALGLSNVAITTAGGVGGQGDITFVDPVAWNSGFGLTATADRHINVNAAITNAGSGGITLNANTAGSIITVAAPISTGGAITLSAAQDILINSSLNSGGAMNLTATSRDITANAAGVLTATGALVTSSGRDTTFGANVMSGGNVTVAAARDITLAASRTLTNGASNTLSMQAAGGSTAGTGNLNLNGNLNVGTGALTLLSGINGTRASWTATGTNLLRQGATFGTVNISGFLNLAINRALNSSATITLTGNNTGGTITVGATGTLDGTTITTNSALDTTINGAVNASGALSMTAGQDILMGAAGSTTSTSTTTFAATRDVTMASGGSVASAALLTIGGRDITLGTVNGGNHVTVNGTRNITTLAGTTLTNGSINNITLNAAGGSTAGTGNLTLNGVLNAGSGSVVLVSGINGTRPSWTVTGTNLLRQGATFGAVSFSGFLNLVINRDINSSGTVSFIGNNTGGTITIGNTYTVSGTGITTSSALDTTINGTLNTTGTLGVTSLQDVIFGVAGSTTSTGASTFTVTRDINMASGSSVNSTGALGMTGRDITLAAINGGNNVTATATRNITTLASTTITNGPTSTLTLNAAGGSTAGTGNLTLNGILNVGSGALTLTSGINGTRPSFTATGTNLLRQGATFGAVTIQGFLNLVIDRDINSSAGVTLTSNNTGGNITINNTRTVSGTAIATNSALDTTINGTLNASTTLGLTSARDIIIGATGVTNSTGLTTVTATQDFYLNGTMDSNGGLTEAVTRDILMGTGGVLDVIGAITLGGRDIILANVNSNNNITATATRNLTTLASTTITNGATGSLTLYAANNVVTGTGNLTLNGVLNVGTGALNLTSGVNGTRPSKTFTAANLLRQGATFGAITITGFLDTFINRDLNSSGNISVTSFRDLTLGATYTVTPGAANNINLQAANNVVTGTGNLYINGILNNGTGTTRLLSGINGTRTNYTMTNTNFLRQGATFGGVSITGFLNTTVDTDINSTGANSIIINSYGDTTINALRTITSGTTGGITLYAANNVVTGPGNLNINGVVRAGTGALNLTSGVNGTRPNFTFNNTNLQRIGATYGAITVNGFLDTVIADNVISNGSITINSFRDLTLNGINTITTGTTGALALRSSNQVVTGVGHLILNGVMNVGNGGLTLLSGVRPVARLDFTATTTNLVPNNTNFGAVNINGFRDTVINRNMTSTAGIAINSYRDLTISATRTVTTAAAGALSLTAANNGITGPGNLYLNGIIGAGSGGLTLLSGINGTRPDWTATTANLLQPGANFGVVSIRGFRDMTIDRNITGTTAVTLVSYRDLTINAGDTVTTGATGALSISAAGAVATAPGRLTINGNLGSGTGALTLLSGINGTRPTWTADSTSLARVGATFGAINIQGFADFIVDRVLNSTSTVTFTGNTRVTLSDDVTSNGVGSAIAFTTQPVYVAEGVTANVTTNNGAITFGSTIDDTIGGAADNLVVNSGTATTTFTGAVNGIGLTATGNILTFTPTSIGATRALQNVALTSTTAFSPPSITASTILVRTTGATANLTLAATRVLTASAAGNAIVLAAGQNFVNSSGVGALVRTGGGRYIIYSTAPAADTTGGLTYDSRRFSCAFASAGTCAFNAPTNSTPVVPGTGNVFLYTMTPIVLVVNPVAIADIIYGSAVPNLTNYAYVPFTLASGYLNADDFANDVITGSINGQTNYTQGSNTGTYNITYLSGDLISALGYGFDYQPLPNAFTVLARHVSVDLTGTAGKVYDGNNTATLSGANYTINNIYSGDVLTLGVSNSGVTYDNKNAGVGKTVTANGLALTGTPAGNYILDNTSAVAGVGTITQRVLTVTGLAPDKVYDATNNSSATLGDDRVGGDVLTITYGTALFADKNVGNGKTVTINGINVTGTDAGNYSFNTSTTDTADITPFALTVGATGVNRVYDGTNVGTVSLSDNRIGGDVLTLSYGSALFGDKNAANGKALNVSGINVTGTDVGNYTFNTTTATTANITPFALTVGATGVNRVYDGTNVGTVTLNDNRIGGDVLTIAYGSALFGDKNVGVGKTVTVSGITVGGTDSGNYSFNTGTTTTANITQRVLTVGATGINRVYNATNVGTVNLSDDRVGGDVLTIGYGSALFGDKNVGVGKTVTVSGITVGGTDSGNYSFNAGTTTAANITQFALTVGASGINKVYDGNATAGITLNDNRVGGDVLSITYGTALFPDKNVGTGRSITVSGINVTGTDAGNYTFNAGTTTTANITPYALIVSASGSSKIYDGNANATVVIGDNRVGGDVLSITYSTALFPDKNAGVGRTITVNGINVTGTDAGNYTFNTSATTTADINKATLTVTAANQNIVYGTVVPATTLGYSGFVGSEGAGDLGTAPVANSGVSGVVNAGTYTNNYTVGGGVDGNYSFVYVPGTLTVGKKTLNVTANSQTVTYGTNVPAGTLTYSGFILGEDATDLLIVPVVNSGQSGIVNAGTYNNNYTVGGGSSNNYDFNYFNGNLVVNKKDLIITASNQSITYGQSVPVGGISYNGFIIGDDATDLDVTPSLMSAQSGVVNAGTYTGNYTVSGGTDNNYAYQYAPGTLTVTQAGLNVTVNNQSVIYGTVVPGTTITYSGFVNGDDEFDLDVLPTIFSGQNGVVNAGTYTGNYTASGAVSGNYSFNYIAGNLVVGQKALNVTAGNRTVTYGTAAPASSLSYSGFIAGEDATFLLAAPTINSGQSGVVNAGTYAGNYTISGGSSNNYYFNFTAGDLIVTARTLNVSATPQTIVYGTAVPVGSITYVGFATGEDATDLITVPTLNSANSGIVDAGTYVNNYTVSGGASNNYTFVYSPANLVVTKRPLSVTANARTITYGTVVPGTTLSYSGFAGGQDATFLDVAPTVNSTQSGIVNAGTYVNNYAASGGIDTNYDFVYTSGALTVNQAALTISANNVNNVYGNNTFSGYSVGGLQLGETIGSVVLGTNASLSSGGYWNTGTWNLNASGASGGTFNLANYTISYLGGTMVITPRVLTAAPSAANRVYDGTNLASVVLGDNRMAGDAISLTYGDARFADKNAGVNRLVTVTGIALGGADASNYNVAGTATTMADITKRVLVITATALDKVYDGSAITMATFADNRVGGDVLVVNYGSALFPDGSLGNYRTVTISGITLGGVDGGNYSVTPTTTTIASIYATGTPPPPPTGGIVTPPTVIKVSQDTGSVVMTATDDGIFATPSTGYQLIYLPFDAPSENRWRNKPLRAGVGGVPIIEPTAWYRWVLLDEAQQEVAKQAEI